ncbi:MAG TPA: SufE family protein [Fibrobacter sp.]|nr:SufE family protein [Fibrobacter sp.]
MSDVALRQKEIQSTFASFQNPDDKWVYLMRLAKEHPPMEASLKTEKFVVQGCAARMFLVPEFKNGLLFFHMDTEGGAESPLISKGLGALALKIYNGSSPLAILNTDPQFFQNIGLNVGLSPTRANGFASLLKQIYLYARAFSAL